MARQDAPERPMPRRTGDLAELRRIQRELAAVRATEARVRVREERLSTATSVAVGAVLAVSVVVLTALLARRGAGETGPLELPVGGAVLGLLFVGAGLAVRRDLARLRWTRDGRARQQLDRLLARNAELWELLAPEPADDLPLPPARQPVRLAGAWHHRYGSGPDPDAVLRALPADAPAWRVRYHRCAGPAGALLAVRVSVVCVVGGVLLVRTWPF